MCSVENGKETCPSLFGGKSKIPGDFNLEAVKVMYGKDGWKNPNYSVTYGEKFTVNDFYSEQPIITTNPINEPDGYEENLIEQLSVYFKSPNSIEFYGSTVSCQDNFGNSIHVKIFNPDGKNIASKNISLTNSCWFEGNLKVDSYDLVEGDWNVTAKYSNSISNSSFEIYSWELPQDESSSEITPVTPTPVAPTPVTPTPVTPTPSSEKISSPLSASIKISNKEIVYSKYETTLVKIKGTIDDDLNEGKTATLSILKPDGKTDEQKLTFGKFGKFETVHLIGKESLLGKYSVWITYGEKESSISSFSVIEKKSVPPTIPAKVPTWVKNNAGWWAEGIIDDSSFTQGLQYLIKEKIMNVESKSQKSADSQEIPAWVKNNAKWWADGSIDETSFISGIEYLVKEGIISVD